MRAWHCLGEFTIGLGLMEAVDKRLPAPGSGAGYPASEHVLPLVLMTQWGRPKFGRSGGRSEMMMGYGKSWGWSRCPPRTQPGTGYGAGGASGVWKALVE